MTDTDLRTEIAAIRETLAAQGETLAAQGASLLHIEKMMDRGHRDSEQRSKQLSDVSERLRLVEAAGASTSDLPRQVHETQITNAVQDAVRNERTEVMVEMGRRIMIGGAVLGMVFSAVQIGISVYL